MYYGQLIGGKDALHAFKQGITCMLKRRTGILEKQAAAQQRAASNAFVLPGEFDSEAQLKQQLAAVDKQISSGYTSMAELYVTDCWSVRRTVGSGPLHSVCACSHLLAC